MNLNIFRNDQNNVGDAFCSPLLYFNIPDTDTADIEDKKILDIVKNRNNIILGGGGLLIYEKIIRQILQLKKNKIISWGLGHNKHNTNKIEKFDSFEKFDLNGIRDYNLEVNYIPCVSCMHKEFDVKREIKYEFVIYEHKHVSLNIDNNIPKKNNSGNNIKQTLDFLGSGETVITNSYHGVYWSILLNRKVIVVPFSSRFLGFKYKIPIVNNLNNWRSFLKKQKHLVRP